MDNRYSIDELRTFVSTCREKGWEKDGTAAAKLVAIDKLTPLCEEEERADVRKIKPADVFQRFHNKGLSKGMTPSTLTAIRSRFTSSIRQFIAYVDNPESWMKKPIVKAEGPKVRPLPAKKSPHSPGSAGGADSSSRQSEGAGLGAFDIKVPLRDSFVTVAGLPKDLKREEAARIAAILNAYAVE